MKGRAKILIIGAILFMGLALFATYILIASDPQEVLIDYLTAWQEGDYAFVYTLLTEENKQELSKNKLIELYQDFAQKSGFTVKEIAEIKPLEKSFKEAKYNCHVWLQSRYLGEIYLSYNFNFKRQGLFNWRLDWNYSNIHPELIKGDQVFRERLWPERGFIFDQKGRPLAIKDEVISIGVQLGRVKDLSLLTAALEEHLGLTPEFIEKKLARYKNYPDWFIPLKTVTKEKYAELDPVLRPIPGILFRKKEARIYPLGEAAAHLIGYLSEVDEKFLQENQEKGYQVGDLVGKAGLESALEDLLRGEVGYTLLFGNEEEKRLIYRKEEIRGQDIYLTLDLDLQLKAWQAMGEKKGALVLLEPSTGRVLALISKPAYDPNLFNLGLSQQEWQEIVNNPANPLFNRALAGLYPPGSVFKIITAAAALDQGIISPDSRFMDSGEYRVKGNIIRNYQGEIFGEHSFREALIHSINTTLAKTGLQLGQDVLREYARRFGLEREYDFVLPIKNSSLGEINDEVDLAWTAIGQAQVLLTPFYVARIISTIAADGLNYQPYFIEKRVSYAYQDQDLENLELLQSERVIKEETARKLKEMLYQVIEEGTGKKAKIEGIKIAGKTGTAEIATGKEETHAWFAALAPLEESQLALAVFLEKGGVGGEDAAAIAHEFLYQVFLPGDDN